MVHIISDITKEISVMLPLQ